MSKLDRYLFRGQRPDNGQFVYGNLILNKSDEKLVNVYIENTDINEFRQWEVIPETVGQFTGLTDKNGFKIFEGDILKCVNPNDRKEFITDFIASLVNGFTFKNISLTRELGLYDNDWPDEIEVIGNIHDNPELL